MITNAKVATLHGVAYTRRLCNHFAHKIPASAEGKHGIIEFPFGVCSIDCDESYMHMKIVVTDSTDVDKAESVVGDHLVRMANKDEPVVIWHREPDQLA